MQIADAWSCQVSIRFEYDESGNQLPVDAIDLEIPFGDRIKDSLQVEGRLRRAQLAVLSGKRVFGDILNMSEEEFDRDAQRHVQSTSGMKFSRNTVCVDIAGPDLTDLSFIDLPGLFQRLLNILIIS